MPMSTTRPAGSVTVPLTTNDAFRGGYKTATEPVIASARKALDTWSAGAVIPLGEAPANLRAELKTIKEGHAGDATIELRKVTSDGRTFLASRISSGRTTDIQTYGALYDTVGKKLNDYEEPDGKRFYFPSAAEQRYDDRVTKAVENLFKPRELGTGKLKSREVSSPEVTALLKAAMPREQNNGRGAKTYKFEVDGQPYYARFHAQGTLVEEYTTWGGGPVWEKAGPSLSLFDDKGRSVGQWTVLQESNSFGWSTIRHAWGL